MSPATPGGESGGNMYTIMLGFFGSSMGPNGTLVVLGPSGSGVASSPSFPLFPSRSLSVLSFSDEDVLPFCDCVKSTLSGVPVLCLLNGGCSCFGGVAWWDSMEASGSFSLESADGVDRRTQAHG